MPQLNPSPWFLILTFTWLVFLSMVPQKVSAHSFPNEPTPQSTQSRKTEPWNWPWH